MASFTVRDRRVRALVRKAGQTRCATFGTKAAAKDWAAKVERELEQLKATGVMEARGITLGDLIDRYNRELYPAKPWGRSKSADLARLKRDLGNRPAAGLTSFALTEYFRKRAEDGSGPVVVSAQAGYLVGVLTVARTVWHLDVPVQAAQDARTGLAKVRLIGKAKRRDRRVTDTEFASIVTALGDIEEDSAVPMVDIARFCMASAMRISEVCRLRWADLNEKDKTILIRDRKHPTDRIGNDQVVPLLDATRLDAFEIVQRQPRVAPRIFPANAKTVGHYFRRAVKDAKLADLHLHDLRHEAISRLFEAGYQIQEVALISGHRDWGMLKRYTHLRAVDLHRRPTKRDDAPAPAAPTAKPKRATKRPTKKATVRAARTLQ